MKLRIKGNSLRLRVTRSELAKLQGGDRVQETIHFSAHPDAQLTYALVIEPQAGSLTVQYESTTMTVLIPQETASIWGREDQVGIYNILPLGSAGQLEVAIEKDFACLDRSDEDNSDTFANPLAGTVC